MGAKQHLQLVFQVVLVSPRCRDVTINKTCSLRWQMKSLCPLLTTQRLHSINLNNRNKTVHLFPAMFSFSMFPFDILTVGFLLFHFCEIINSIFFSFFKPILLLLQTAPPSPGLHSLWTEPPPAPAGAPSNMSQYFDLYDVKESSYHTFISRLDLHICNDSSSMDEGQ